MSRPLATQSEPKALSQPLVRLAGDNILQRKCACGQHTIGAGECSSCSKERELPLQRSGVNRTGSHGGGVSPIVNVGLGSPSPELDAATRSFIEPRFSHDFSRIRIRTEAQESEHVQPVRGKSIAPANTNGSGSRLPFLDSIQRSFGYHNISDVRAHTDSVAAAAIGAEAFARGSDVTFSRMPSLHTAAHEAAHVIQQRAGVEVTGGMGQEGDAYEQHADEVADRVVRGQSSEGLLDTPPASAEGPERPSVVQLRRIPPNIRALVNGANTFANIVGAQRLIDEAMESLSDVDQATVLTNRRGSLTEVAFNALPIRERLSRHADAIIALFPDRELFTDPRLVEIGPRPGLAGIADALNIVRLVNNTDQIFADIATGHRDEWLKQVFGASNVRAAKEKYKMGRQKMHSLFATNKIVTDRSGFTEEVGQGGRTNRKRILVAKGKIDPINDPVTGETVGGPDDHESIVTLLHESMHAGNRLIDDKGYINSPGFQTDSAANKLTNAAHFEVVAWRILNPADPRAFAKDLSATPPTFHTFTPAGATANNESAPDSEKGQKGAKAASELFRRAWSIASNIHQNFYLPVLRRPRNWPVLPYPWNDKRLDRSLPYWSKVENLTVHEKQVVDPASPDEAKHPISKIDVALSEGLIRKLGNGIDVLASLDKESDVLAFEVANTTSDELATAAHSGVFHSAETQRDFLLKLAVQHRSVKPMTGDAARDVRVVRELGNLDWITVLNPRNPSSFPD